MTEPTPSTPWLNDSGCDISFEKLAAINEHGNEIGYATYSWWCRCGLHRDDHEQLDDCVRDARAHIEE